MPAGHAPGHRAAVTPRPARVPPARSAPAPVTRRPRRRPRPGARSGPCPRPPGGRVPRPGDAGSWRARRCLAPGGSGGLSACAPRAALAPGGRASRPGRRPGARGPVSAFRWPRRRPRPGARSGPRRKPPGGWVPCPGDGPGPGVRVPAVSAAPATWRPRRAATEATRRAGPLPGGRRVLAGAPLPGARWLRRPQRLCPAGGPRTRRAGPSPGATARDPAVSAASASRRPQRAATEATRRAGPSPGGTPGPGGRRQCPGPTAGHDRTPRRTAGLRRRTVRRRARRRHTPVTSPTYRGADLTHRRHPLTVW